ncbi:hypothetical protein [Solimonas soli]|uniref:hypothetical protein n=1 Tax=Solimonas soli TaxID=413479 RepID=UPI0004864C1C|nr:hypothetical protein [Solimonas soli]
MRQLGIIAVCGAALLIGACSNTRRCDATLPYQKAETLPPPAAVPGLTVPDSPSALRIPPPPASDVPFGQRVAEAQDRRDTARYECLDTPPRLAGSAELQQAERDNKAGKKVPDANEGEKKKHWWWPF